MICNIIFWIENDAPPPFGTFPKIHPTWLSYPSLSPIGSSILYCVQLTRMRLETEYLKDTYFVKQEVSLSNSS